MRKAAIIIVAGAALAGVIAVLLGSTQDSATPDGRLSRARAAELGREVRSGDRAQVADAVKFPPGAQPSATAVHALARLRAVSLSSGSFRRLAADTALVRARVVNADGARQVWAVTLVFADDKWKVALSRPLAER